MKSRPLSRAAFFPSAALLTIAGLVAVACGASDDAKGTAPASDGGSSGGHAGEKAGAGGSAGTGAQPHAASGGAPQTDGGDAGVTVTVADGASLDAASLDAARDALAPAPVDGGDGSASAVCDWTGAPGVCVAPTACAALRDHTAFAGSCAGDGGVECCIQTPNVADNPPVPLGYKLMPQADVTPDMTTWTVEILHDTAAYPLFASATQMFGSLTVMARVEWHPPDFQNGAVHRGVTLYVPA